MASEKVKRVAKELGRVCVDETGRKPFHTHCILIVERHYAAALAAGFNRPQPMAVFCYEREKDDLLASADARDAELIKSGRKP